MKKLIAYLLVLAVCVIFAGQAAATVVCTVSSSGTAFGAYDPLSGLVKDTLGTIAVTCTGSNGDPVNYSIALSVSGPRNMQAGSSQLNYTLYTDMAHSAVWGDGSLGTSTVSDTYTMSGTSATRNYTVYGEIPVQGLTGVGSYLDSVSITVTY
jgi:spore coat protein U-like protein